MAYGDESWPAASSGTSTLIGFSVYDGATGKVHGDYVFDEDGNAVPAAPGEGIRGVVLSPVGGRFITEAELAQNAETTPQPEG